MARPVLESGTAVFTASASYLSEKTVMQPRAPILSTGFTTSGYFSGNVFSSKGHFPDFSAQSVILCAITESASINFGDGALEAAKQLLMRLLSVAFRAASSE